MKDKFVILCCENIRWEADSVISTGALPRAEIRSFPFHCGHIKSAWEQAVSEYKELEGEGARIILCGCGCSNRFNIPGDILEGQSLILLGTGASLFLPEDLINDYQKNGMMVIMPGWLSRWRQNFACDRLDRTTARQIYTESIKGIVLLDTGVHLESAGLLAEFSEFIDLPARTIPVGTEYFRLLLTNEYIQWQFEREISGFKARIRDFDKRVADYSMVADLTGKIIGIRDENIIIGQILDLLFLLFSPKKVGLLPVNKGKAGSVVSFPPGSYAPEDLEESFSEPEGQYEITDTGDGFRFRIMYGDHVVGILSIDGVLLPGYLHEYLNLTHFISQIGGLSITIARTYQDLQKAVEERDAEIVERKNVEEALRQANKKLNMLSSITRHDILNQIMVVRGYLELSNVILDNLDDPTIREYMEKEYNAIDAIQQQIEFTRYYQDIGVEEPKWQDAGEIVESAMEQLDFAGIKLINSLNGLEVFADPLIGKVFYNLIENSRRHGGHVTAISFSYLETGEGLVIS